MNDTKYRVKMIRRIKFNSTNIDTSITLVIDAFSEQEAAQKAKQSLGKHWLFAGAVPIM